MKVSISHPTNRPNYAEVAIGDLTVVFSYSTPIAFYPPNGGRVVRENDWSATTGRHLSFVDGGSPEAKKARVTGAAFEAALEAITDRLNFDCTAVR